MKLKPIFTKVSNQIISINNLTDTGATGKIKITTPKLLLPFGIESYLKQKIVNAELMNFETDTTTSQFYTLISQIESQIEQTKDEIAKLIPDDTNFLNKNFISILRKTNNYNPKLRCHVILREHAVVTTINALNESTKATAPLCILDIKKNDIATLNICIDTLWISSSGWGIVCNINNINKIVT